MYRLNHVEASVSGYAIVNLWNVRIQTVKNPARSLSLKGAKLTRGNSAVSTTGLLIPEMETCSPTWIETATRTSIRQGLPKQSRSIGTSWSKGLAESSRLMKASIISTAEEATTTLATLNFGLGQ